MGRRIKVHEVTTGGAARLLAVLLVCAALLQPNALRADPVPVRYTEGLTHGFLVLQTLEGKTIADGQMTQVAQGDRVKQQLTFRFKDGSTYEETTIFHQRGHFRLLSDHVVQRGPSFKRPTETSINASTGQITVRYTENGKDEVLNEQLEMPSDISNGMIFTLMKNIQPNVPRTTVSMLVTTPKPRLVKLAIIPEGSEPFSIGNFKHKAMRYVLKIEIGGLAGWLARLFGKQPPDTHVWVLGGEAPAFVKSEGPFNADGPIWRIQLASAGIF
jgi:hypothetical protein